MTLVRLFLEGRQGAAVLVCPMCVVALCEHGDEATALFMDGGHSILVEGGLEYVRGVLFPEAKE
jgi:hypothetical protein